ncbi:MAG: VOC family protein [Actinobacteria bacterium]|nr:VOC family protein [Actinomycetota bacterium]
MPLSTGVNHVATVTPDLDRLIDFYGTVFDAPVVLEITARPDHPRMAIIDLGGGGALNIFEVPPDSIVGDRTAIGARGPVDHFGISVAGRAEVDTARERLVAYGCDVGDIQVLGDDTWSLFFRDPDGMELEVCAPVAPGEE